MQKIITLCAFILLSVNAGFAGNWGFGSTTQGRFNEALEEARLGIKGAACEVGMFYLEGFGTEVDYEQGLTWLKEGYDKEDLNTTLSLGMCYLAGFGIKRDIDKAKELFKTIISKKLHGFLRAKTYNTLCLLLKKEIVGKKAFDEWSKLMEADRAARYCLGQCFKYGFGVEANEGLSKFFSNGKKGDRFDQDVITTCFEAYKKSL